MGLPSFELFFKRVTFGNKRTHGSRQTTAMLMPQMLRPNRPIRLPRTRLQKKKTKKKKGDASTSAVPPAKPKAQ